MNEMIYELTRAVIHGKLKGKDRDDAINLVISYHQKLKNNNSLTLGQKKAVASILRRVKW